MGISLCMIVKNEEDWIAGCLASVRSIVDEIVLADTGCTDQTIQRALPYAPKIISFQWPNSFAEARNRTLAEARHPWVLVLDADERIAAPDLQKVVDATRAGSDGYHLIQRNYVFVNQVFGWTPNSGDYEEGRQYPGYVDNPLIRLFRNHSEIRFRGAVHEIIDPTTIAARHLRFDTAPVVLHHYGKVRESERVAAKQRMYLELGLKKVKDDPSNAKAYFDLGIQYQELQQHAEASECFEKTFSMTRLPVALLYRAISEKHRGNNEAALKLLKRAIELGLNTSDVRLELGNVLLALNRASEALKEYRASLQLRADNPIAAFNCGLALRKLDDPTNAETYYRRALELDPSFRLASLELAIMRATSGRTDEAADMLHSLIKKEPDYREARLTLAKTYIQSNRPSDALSALERSSIEDAVARSLIGAALFQQGNIDEAQAHLEWAVRRDRSLVDARINLAQIYAQKGDHGRAERFRVSARMGMPGASQ